MPRKKKKETRKITVSFDAIVKIPKKVNVNFTTKTGEKVSFDAINKVPKKVKIVFDAKKKRK